MTRQNLLKEQGYINDIDINKCWCCDSTNLLSVNQISDDNGSIDFEIICPSCNTTLGGFSSGTRYLNVEYGDLNFF